MEDFIAAQGEIIELRQVVDETGAILLRVKVIDGKKFHHFDLDPATAAALARSIELWVSQ